MSNSNGLQAKTIGYTGLGNAGYPLASTISRSGYHMVIQDANSKQAQKFSSEHSNAMAVETNNDLRAFGNVDVLVTMLPNGEIVRDVLLGK